MARPIYFGSLVVMAAVNWLWGKVTRFYEK
jgi:hypothetical protein